MGLVVESVTYEDVLDVAPGHVIAQSPESGTVVSGRWSALVVAETVPSADTVAHRQTAEPGHPAALRQRLYHLRVSRRQVPEGTVTAQAGRACDAV